LFTGIYAIFRVLTRVIYKLRRLLASGSGARPRQRRW
jgi:hypothetical protein